ncbi:hypothetical protein [Embleya hyalina]|uniref:Secreted protein n=1 Tax=Embleya hyalina TaxID=516124 RepID=A0A401YJE1_9ACTN|nr:hypothetical protein [Embleya hyalina]GCD94720.1 hypothetical protein EHYA_02389 [Embleya hyalina]
MSKTARRQISRIVGTSCLAAALALPTAAAAAAPRIASPGQATSRVPVDTPEPPNTPQAPAYTPPPPDTPNTPNAPNTPNTPNSPNGPNQPNTPGTGTPGAPGTPSSGTPGTPGPGGSSRPPNQLQQVAPPPDPKTDPDGAKREVEAEIDKLDVPPDVKQKLKEGLNTAVNAIKNSSTSTEDRNRYAEAVSAINQTLKAIQDPTTSVPDRLLYTKIVQGVNEALRRSQDPKLAVGERGDYLKTAQGVAQIMVRLQDPTFPATERGFAIQVVTLISDALLASKDPKTAPKKPVDQQQIRKVLQATATATAQATATLQDPKASPQAKDAARQTLAAQANVLRNPKYLEFLNEVKRYNPTAECLTTIETRTRQAGWPDGSLWGLADDTCSDALTQAVADTGSKWNALFTCVQQNAFSTCPMYIPKD